MEGILDNYKRIYQLLEDEQSRDIYLNKLNWLISGDLKYVEAILTAYLPEVPLIGRKTVSDLKFDTTFVTS